MATLKKTVTSALEADPTLTALVTGGIYDASELGPDGLPGEEGIYDTRGRLLPTLSLKWTGGIKGGNLPSSRWDTLEVWFYEFSGTVNIDQMLAQVYELLDHRTFNYSDGQAQIHWVQNTENLSAEELSNAPASFSRYRLTYHLGDR